MPSKKHNRQLAAVMFADIVGYTAIMQEDETKAIRLRARHREVFEQDHKQFSGTIIQYYGDGVLSIFNSAVEAVKCAISIQHQLTQTDLKVPLRIGLHMGDIVHSETEVFGDGVNVASRVESLGIPGSVLISGKLNDELKNQKNISTRSLGTVTLKNVSAPVEIFAVSEQGLSEPSLDQLNRQHKTPEKSIAVLPFVNMSTSAENEYFSDGMTEEIINALTRVEGLKVTSRTSSFFFKNKNIPVPDIGKELNVSTILEGSIRLAGNQMRITAQLIDVKEDYHFWSETFDRSLDDIFAVQDEISLLIAERLREHLGHFDLGDHLVESQNVPAHVYQQYLKSRYLLLQMTKGDLDEGIRILEEILVEYPKYALAHLGIHLAYTLMGTLGLTSSLEGFAKGNEHLQQALTLNKNLPECQLHLAWNCFIQEWDFEGTYRHLNNMKQSRPMVDYYQTMASTLGAEGKFDAAHHYIDTALQIDPFSHINCHLKGFILYSEEKYDEALECFRKSLELKPDAHVSVQYVGTTLILKGEVEESYNYFQGLKEDPHDPVKIAGTVMAQLAANNHADAEKGMVKLESAMESDSMGRVMSFLILCKTLSGDHEAALDLIEDGIEKHLPLLIYLPVEPVLKPLRSHPRFKEITRRLLGDTVPFVEPSKHYKKSSLDPESIEELGGKLTTLMQEEKMYLNPDLSLRLLAEHMDVPPNRLSELLNVGFNKNFAEFVNQYRLEAFKQKAADPDQRHLTILALAFESGFNSKTVFNTYFKKKMGQTPKSFWNSALSQ
jgi:TolB-like protein/AraC-like DNA-binding protein